MNFDEEYWVKLYTKDTPNWLVLSYDAKSLLMHLFRKASRKTGEIDLGTLGPRGIAYLVGHPDLWESRFEKPLRELQDQECIRIEGPILTVVNFAKAQRRPGTERSRKSRERARAEEIAMPGDPDPESEPPGSVQRDAAQCNDSQRSATQGNEVQQKRKDKGAPERAGDQDGPLGEKSPHWVVVDLWYRKYQEKYGTKPAPKDWHFAVLNKLRRAHGYAELVKRIDLLFDDPPKFLASHAPDIPTLEQHWDKLLPSTSRKMSGAQIRLLSGVSDDE